MRVEGLALVNQGLGVVQLLLALGLDFHLQGAEQWALPIRAVVEEDGHLFIFGYYKRKIKVIARWTNRCEAYKRNPMT